MKIYPIPDRGPVTPGEGTPEVTPSINTAAKVSRIKIPNPKTGFGGRKIKQLDDVRELSQMIRTDWDEFEPEELAEKIIELERRVGELSGPGVDKVKKLAQKLHFNFVFPAALELDPSRMMSFARTIQKMADQVMKTQSLDGLKELNRTQQYEVYGRKK